jgi:hypothetical protein
MGAKVTAVKLLELLKKVVTFDKSLGIHINGFDNNYPERVERIINNSATAKPAAKLYRKYLLGRGLSPDMNDFIVNPFTGITLLQFLRSITVSMAYQNGVAIHINYNLNFDKISLTVIPFGHCRVGKKDDKDYNSKIIVSPKWSEFVNIKDLKPQIFDVYNPDPKVIQQQINKAGGIKNYKGQIFFYHPESDIYPLAHVDNVMMDADSEHMSSVFKNTSLRKGFFGKKIVITPPMLDSALRTPDSELDDEMLGRKKLQLSERDAFRKDMLSFIGADNSQGAFHVELEYEGDDIDKAIKFIDVETNINDSLFQHTENSCANNIRKAYSNIPSILIENNDGSMFGQSGEMLNQAKMFYQDQTEEDRDTIESEILKPMLYKFSKFEFDPKQIKIIPLIQKPDVNNQGNNTTL